MTDVNAYFAFDVPAEVAATGGTYLNLEDIEPVNFLEGLVFQPILTDTQLVNFVRYEPNVDVPEHAHVEEQITFVVDGEFEFTLGGDVRIMRRGMVAVIPPWVPHGARTYDSGCFQIDVFVPPRAVLAEVIRSRSPSSSA